MKQLCTPPKTRLRRAPAQLLFALSLGLTAIYQPTALAQEAIPTEPAAQAEANVEASSDASAASKTDSEASNSAASPGLFESSVSPGAGATGPSIGPVHFGGYVRGDAYVGRAIGATNQGELKAAYGEIAIQARAEKEDLGDAFADLRLRYGLQDTERRLFLSLPEAYVHSKLGFFEFTLGQQIIIWGRSSSASGSSLAAQSPLDTLAPIDYRIRSPWDSDHRSGNLGARAFLNFRPLRIEGVYLPLYQAVQYPAYDPQAGTKPGKDVFPGVNLQEGTGAARVHLELESFKAAASFATGYSQTPGFVYNHVDNSDPARSYALISRIAYSQQTFGLDVAGQVSPWLQLRAEAAYRNPRTPPSTFTPKADIGYVAGIDLTLENASATLQYMGRHVLEHQAVPNTPISGLPQQFLDTPQIADPINTRLAWLNQGLFQQRYALQHAVSVNFEVFLAKRALSLGAFGMMNFTSTEFAVLPRIRYRFAERLTLSAGADIYSGPPGSFFAYLSPALTAGYLELKAAF